MKRTKKERNEKQVNLYGRGQVQGRGKIRWISQLNCHRFIVRVDFYLWDVRFMKTARWQPA